MIACDKGHTGCTLALLASPAINVNHADVSISIHILFPVVVRGYGWCYLPHYPVTLIHVMMSYKSRCTVIISVFLTYLMFIPQTHISHPHLLCVPLPLHAPVPRSFPYPTPIYLSPTMDPILRVVVGVAAVVVVFYSDQALRR